MLKISLFEAFYSNIARTLADKWMHEGILFIAWILILSHNEKDIKVSENSLKKFSDAHPPLILIHTENIKQNLFIDKIKNNVAMVQHINLEILEKN